MKWRTIDLHYTVNRVNEDFHLNRWILLCVVHKHDTITLIHHYQQCFHLKQSKNWFELDTSRSFVLYSMFFDHFHFVHQKQNSNIVWQNILFDLRIDRERFLSTMNECFHLNHILVLDHRIRVLFRVRWPLIESEKKYPDE